MLNDNLAIRFIHSDESRHDVEFARAAAVVLAANEFCSALLTPFCRQPKPDQSEHLTRLVLIANPQRGSLELLLQLDIGLSIDLEPGFLNAISSSAGSALSVAADLASVGAFILALGFYPNGVFARKTSQHREPIERSGTDDAVDRLVPSVSEQVIDHIDVLLRAAAATQCVRVEAEFRGLGTVQLIPSDYRRSPAIIGRRVQQKNRPEFSLVRLDPGSDIGAKTESGNASRIYLARSSDGDAIALVWNRSDSPPADLMFEVKGEWVDNLNAFSLDDEVPSAFEQARGCFAVANWREAWR